jgi:hypothetical protein
MAKFLDYHTAMPPLPKEAVEQMAARIRAGQVDSYGVKGLNVFMGDGQGWCLTEAPDADAVCQSHGALGFPLERKDVHEVMSLV